MKETYYFSHDFNARNDPKILAMRSKYGSEGYGWYWMIIEILREQSEYKLEHNKYLCITLAMQLQCDCNALHNYVEDCINEYHLFESDGVYIWSNSLMRRMEEKVTKSENAKKAAKARWNKASKDKKDTKKCNDNADAMQPQCDSNAIKESKRKESKGKENKREREDNSYTQEALELCKYYSELKPGQDITSDLASLEIFIERYGFDWTKEAIQKCVSGKGKFIKPWVETVLKNWVTERKVEVNGANSNNQNNREDEVAATGETEGAELTKRALAKYGGTLGVVECDI